MPIRDHLVAAALTGLVGLAAAGPGCAINPDPRKRPIDIAVADGRGGWFVATLAAGTQIEGELISIDGDAVRVLTSLGLVPLSPSQITSAKLWAWDPKIDGVVVWGTLGTVSTVSHGFFLVLSAPAWLLTTTVVAAVESRHPILEFPEHRWADFTRWARFPQGMPPGLRPDDLLNQVRAPVGTQPGQHGPPGAPAPGEGSGSGAAAGSAAGSGSGAP